MDLNGDGYIDILSGSWPGELFLFRGGPGRTFAPPEMIKDKTGNYINIGGGIRDEPGGGILITGNGEFEKTADGYVVNYHGKKMKSTAEKPVSVTGTASAVFAFDWDADGDLDLIVGDIRGNVHLVPNEGSAKAYAFGNVQKLLAPMRVQGDAGPHVADWDGDGLFDLLVGAGDGSVTFFKNVGSTKAPKLAAGLQLVTPVEAKYGSDAPNTAQRGTRSKI